jgi:hypothetical protein
MSTIVSNTIEISLDVEYLALEIRHGVQNPSKKFRGIPMYVTGINSVASHSKFKRPVMS